MDDKGGIQSLLAAEQDAQHIVANARAAKTQRLRQAKEEAEREVAVYRSQREAEFKKKQEQSTGSVDSNVRRLEEVTEDKIEVLKKEASKVSHEVSRYLLKDRSIPRSPEKLSFSTLFVVFGFPIAAMTSPLPTEGDVAARLLTEGEVDALLLAAGNWAIEHWCQKG